MVRKVSFVLIDTYDHALELQKNQQQHANDELVRKNYLERTFKK
jgi:hypothetical protein